MLSSLRVPRSSDPSETPSRPFTNLALTAALLMSLLAPEVARAQMMGADDLIALADTRLRRQLSRYIGDICGPLQAETGSQQVDLAATCTSLADTATVLSGGGATGNELDLTEEELLEAIDDIAHRQLPATAKSSSEISAVHTAAVSSRLFALRQEEAPDILLAGTLIDSDGDRLPIHYQWDRDEAAAGVRERMPEGLGLYLNGNGAFGDRDSDDEEAGFDFRNLGFTAGADYRITDTSVAGGAFTYLNAFQDFKNAKGEIDVDIVAFSFYGTQRINQAYVNAIATYAHGEIDLERELVFATFDRTAKGDTSSDEFSIAIGGGYEFQWEGLSYGPMMEWEWIWLDIQSFNESGANGLNLDHDHDEMKSATVDLGLEGSHPISTRWGVFIPQLAVAWVHQFEDDSREIRARYEADNTGASAEEFFVETDDPDRNYAKISAAVSGSFRRGISGYLSYQAIVGHNRLSSHAFSFGGRISF